MAHLHNFHQNQKPSFFSGFGQKVKNTAEVLSAVKSIYDIGKGVYSVVAPAVLALA